MSLHSLDLDAVEAMLVGCAALGAGGGGDLETGLARVRALMGPGGPPAGRAPAADGAAAREEAAGAAAGRAAAARVLTLVSPGELPDDAWVGSPYYVGAVSPGAVGSAAPAGASPSGAVPAAGAPATSGTGPTVDEVDELEPMVAFRELEAYLGVRFEAVVATELGGGNTAVAAVIAAALDRPLIDGDPAGRAVPELIHSTFYLHGLPIAPFALANRFGDVAIVRRVADDARAEAIARSFAVASGNRAGVTDHPMRAATLKQAVIPGTLTRSLAIGQARAQALRSGEDPAQAMAAAGGGVVLLRGEVAADSTWEDRGGLTLGEVVLSGTGAAGHASRRVRVVFRNEHMYLEELPPSGAGGGGGRILATIPDVIALVEPDTGWPLLNPVFRRGTPVAVLAFPGPAAWRTPEGLRIFGPAYAGLTSPYVPVEQLFAAEGGTA